MQKPGMLQKQHALGRLDQAELDSPKNRKKAPPLLTRSSAEKLDLVQPLPAPLLTRRSAERLDKDIMFQQDLSDFALVVSEDNQTLLLNGLPARNHGFHTLADFCDYIGAVCLSHHEQSEFDALVAAASLSDSPPSAQVRMLSFLLRVVNEYCVSHQSSSMTESSTLVCVCPDKVCPVFVIRLLSGSPALLRVLRDSFRSLNTDVLILALRLTWRLYHIAHVCAPRCSRFRCLVLSEDNVHDGCFWTRVIAEVSCLPSLREPAFTCLVGLMVDRTEADLTVTQAEACLFREDVANPWLLPHAFTLLRGTSLSFQLKGLTDLFSSLLGHGSKVYPVNYNALCPDHETGVLHLLSDLVVSEYKHATETADIEITLLAYLATSAMHFFRYANFACCVNRTMSILNGFGPVGESLRRVHIMRHFLMSLMKIVRHETGSIDRNMGQGFLNFLDLAGVILQFVLFHGYHTLSGPAHFPVLEDLVATSVLSPSSGPHPPPRPFAVSLHGPLKLHLATRQEYGWCMVAEDIKLLRMLEETCRSLDFNPDLYRGSEDVRRSLRVGQLLHNTLGSVLGVFAEASLHDPRLSLVPTPFPSRRKMAGVVKSSGDGDRTSFLAPSREDDSNKGSFLVGTHVSAEDSDLPAFNPSIARFDTVALPRSTNSPASASSPSFPSSPLPSTSATATAAPTAAASSTATPTHATASSSPAFVFNSPRPAQGVSLDSLQSHSPHHRKGKSTEVSYQILLGDLSTPQEKINAQAPMTKIVNDLVIGVEAMLNSHDASVVFKYLQTRSKTDPAILPSIIMEGTVLMSHGVNVKSVYMHLEPDRFCYQNKDSKHVVPLSAIKYIEPDVAQSSEVKGEEGEPPPASFSVVSKIDSFVITCPDFEVRDIWVNLLSFATARIRMEVLHQGDCLDGLYVLATSRFKKSPLAVRAAHSISNTLFAFRNIRVSTQKPAALKIQKTNVVPLYTADSQCTGCTATLSVFRRIKHCRNCGRGFCNKCVSRLRGSRFNMSKICYKCYVELDEREDVNRSLLAELSGGKPSQVPVMNSMNEGLRRGKAAVDLLLLPSAQLKQADHR